MALARPVKRVTLEHHSLSIAISEDGSERTIAVFGETDAASAETLKRQLQEAIHGDAESVVIDLSGLDFIDSMGVAALLFVVEDAKTNGTKLGVLRGPATVERVFAITGLDQLLPFRD